MSLERRARTEDELLAAQEVAGILLDSGCLTLFDTEKFASIDLSRLSNSPEKQGRIALLLAKLIKERCPDCNTLVAVPGAAITYVNYIGRLLNIEFRVRPKIEEPTIDLLKFCQRYEIAGFNADLLANSQTVIFADAVKKDIYSGSGSAITEVRHETKGRPVLGIVTPFNYSFVETIHGVPIFALCNFSDLLEQMGKTPSYAGWIKPLTTWHSRLS
jgi:hypothetical protein